MVYLEGGILTMDDGNRALPDVTIYTDGCCLGNPGPGGYGVVLLHGQRRKELSGGFRRTTNNRMELRAALTGLQRLKKRCRVTLYTDSRYLVDAVNQGWIGSWRKNGWQRKGTPIPNADLWQELLKLWDQHDVTLVWVRGHAGNPENERCDQLSKEAARQPGLPVDTGYMQAGTAVVKE